MDGTKPHSNSEGSLYQLLVFETTLECLRMNLAPFRICSSLKFSLAELDGTS
jgi:hypothetical protein